VCTIPSNLAGHCAISVPFGVDPAHGLPIGVQVLGRELADALVFRVAQVLEAGR
jgi:aspartyl-tRNA(Asn)/glutamyl-tRNA(Gln) amidotransferase subunit A